jgi:hypothetical protein
MGIKDYVPNSDQGVQLLQRLIRQNVSILMIQLSAVRSHD